MNAERSLGTVISDWVRTHKRSVRIATAGAIAGGGALGVAIACTQDQAEVPDQPTTAPRLTKTPLASTTATVDRATATIVPAVTPTVEARPTFAADPELVVLLKEKCTPGIDLPLMSEAQLATALVNRENAVQFLSQPGLKFRLQPAEPFDPNLPKKSYLLTCKIPLEEGTRYAGVNLAAENQSGMIGLVDSYDKLVSLLSGGGTRSIDPFAARALPFFNQDTSSYIVREVDGPKQPDTENLVHVRVVRENSGECEEAVYAIVVANDPLGRYEAGQVIDSGSDRGSLLGQDCVVGGAKE